MSNGQNFAFTISPEPRHAGEATGGNYVDITFMIQNVSGRPVRVEIIPEALTGPIGQDNETFLPELLPDWQDWLELRESAEEPLRSAEWTFDVSSVRTCVLRINIPEQHVDLGRYQFRLLVVGVADPDHEFAASEVVTFNVVGPQINVRRFVIAALVILAVIIALAVGLALLFEPEPRLTVTMEPPESGMVGQVMTTTLLIENTRPVSATQVVVDYVWPEGIVAATAVIPQAAFRYCEEQIGAIRCDLGALGPQETATIILETVPGPATSIITHTSTLTVSSFLENEKFVTPADVAVETTPINPAQGLSVVIDPSAGIGTVEEPLTYRLLAWNNITASERVSVTFTLAQGMRYQRLGAEQVVALPTNCQQRQDDYFTLDCSVEALGFVNGRSEVADFNIPVVPSEIAASRTVLARATAVNLDLPPTNSQFTLPVVNSALEFDGVNDYAELGFAQSLPSLTAEMWIQPASTNDGQSFIGVHRESLPNLNLFLVGYWLDGVNVTIGEEYYNIDAPPLTRRYHLAVTVEQINARQSSVTVYIDGQPQPWREPESTGTCAFCKIFNSILDSAPTLPWVLGQEWDPIGNTRRPSDFFKGTISDVRLWDYPRTQDEIQTGMRIRPVGNESGLVAYERLEPVDPQSVTLIDLAGSNGRRYDANWGESIPRFGSALAFDGVNDMLTVPGMQLSNMNVTSDGKVQVTLAGWLYVDAIPTEEEWVMGFAGASAQTVTLPNTIASDGLNPAIMQTIDTVTGAAETQNNLAAAQGRLLDAIEAQNALAMTSDEARAKVQEARDALYLTLEPLGDATAVSAAFAPTAGVIDTALASLGGDLLRLQTVPGIQEAVQEARLAQKANEITQTTFSGDALSETDRIRVQLHPKQTELAYAQSLVNLWQIIARDQITQTGIIDAPLSLTDANLEAAKLTAVSDSLAALPLADKTLLALSALELAESEQLAAGFLITAESETAVNTQFDNLTNADPADIQLAENIQAAQATFDNALSELSPWLDEQLDTDVNLLLFPERGAQIRDERLRQRLFEEAGLIGYWDFNEGGGTVVQDKSGNGYHGALQQDGAAFISAASPITDMANPFALTGEGTEQDLVRVNHAPRINGLTNNFSVSAWFLPAFSTGGQLIFGTNLANSANDGFSFGIAPGIVYFSNHNREGDFTQQVELNYGQWQHIAIIMNNNDLTYYIDGVNIGTEAGVGPISADLDDDLVIGRSFRGYIDEFRVYNRVLTPEEVATLAGGSAPINVDEQLTLQKLLATRAITELQTAVSNLLASQNAESEVAEAKIAVATVDAEAAQIDQITQEAQQTLAERAVLETAVSHAQSNVLNATTPAEQETAQRALNQAQADLLQAQLQDFQNLQSSLASLGLREETLQNLTVELDTAVNNAVEAGMAAAQKNNVELLIGPYLDWILGTRTPRKTTQEVVQTAALLAAQQALKSGVDYNVDAALAKLEAATAERDRLISSGGNARLRQDIINNINAYIESLNSEVASARQELDDALAAQQGRQQEPDIPLVLADALAQEVALRVANQIALRIRPSFRQLLTPNPAVGEQIKTQLRQEMANALLSTRNPVRWQTYIDTYFVILRLDQELNSGVIDNETERALKLDLKQRLEALNLALLRVLNAQNVILRPQIGLSALINQVADEGDRAASEEALIAELQTAINNARLSIESLIQFENLTSLKNGSPNANGKRLTMPIEILTRHLQATGAGTAIRQGGDSNPPQPTGDGTNQSNGSNTSDALLQGIDKTETAVLTTTQTITETATSLNPLPSIPPVPPNIWLGVIIDDDGHVAFVARPRSAGWTAVKDEKPISVGQWVHYAAVLTYDINSGTVESLQLFRNGDEVKGADLIANPITVRVDNTGCPPGFYVGGLCPTGQQFAYHGMLDEIRVWNRALSEKEIDGWRDLPGEFFNEYAYWAFDDGPGRTSADVCGLDLTCDRSPHAFHIRVAGPSWIASDFNTATPGFTRP
ncbi:MAG: hypothetical protein H6667_25150 [Ardenticatenaceae bacterium]|nr:hypothetical protein [Ardenticatenaceae bacterium]